MEKHDMDLKVCGQEEEPLVRQPGGGRFSLSDYLMLVRLRSSLPLEFVFG